jgi:hypothetical protein
MRSGSVLRYSCCGAKGEQRHSAAVLLPHGQLTTRHLVLGPWQSERSSRFLI